MQVLLHWQVRAVNKQRQKQQRSTAEQWHHQAALARAWAAWILAQRMAACHQQQLQDAAKHEERSLQHKTFKVGLQLSGLQQHLFVLCPVCLLNTVSNSYLQLICPGTSTVCTV